MKDSRNPSRPPQPPPPPPSEGQQAPGPPAAGRAPDHRLMTGWRLGMLLLLPCLLLLVLRTESPFSSWLRASDALNLAAVTSLRPLPPPSPPSRPAATDDGPEQQTSTTATAAPVPTLFERRLREAIEAVEAALLSDDEARAARTAAAPSDDNGPTTHYDLAAAVPAGLRYPDGAPAVATDGGGRRSDDALFRTTLEALLLAADADPDEGEKTYHILLRGASISAGGDEVGKHGREILHQKEAWSLLSAAFAATPLRWRLIDMAKGNTESSDSLATFNLFDPTVSFDAVRLVLWEYSHNDELNLKQPAVFERWIRTYLHWYPNADLGFIFVPGKTGPKPDVNATGIDLALVSDTETTYRKIIDHYASAAGQDDESSRTLFMTSLGPCIEASGRFPADFYGMPPANPHPAKLGYQAMADMLAHHIKSRIRAALAFARTALAECGIGGGSTPHHCPNEVRRAAGSPRPAPAEDERASSKWLSLPASWSAPDKGGASSAEAPLWLYQPPGPDSPEWEAMTDANYMRRAVKLYTPNPCGRDIEGVEVECLRADGATTWEPGMVYALERLIDEAGCVNLQGIPQRSRQLPGRVDYEINLQPPLCDAADQSAQEEGPDDGHPSYYTLRVPFAFTRFNGGVLWPPSGLALYLNGEPVGRDAGRHAGAPVWTFDPPVEAGATLRLCWNATTPADGGGQPLTVYNSLVFT